MSSYESNSNHEGEMTMNDLLNMMEDDFEKTVSSVEKIDQNKLTSVASVAKAIRVREELILDLEQKLKDEKKALLKMTDEDLPSLLAEAGLSSFTLDDGSKVEIKQTYGGSILVENRPKAFEWLRENEHGDIIKNKVSCQFGQGEDQEAEAFVRMAQSQGYPTDQKEEVHPQKLRAWIKEMVEKGNEFPMELFGAYIGQRAVIKGSK